MAIYKRDIDFQKLDKMRQNWTKMDKMRQNWTLLDK